MKRRAKVQNDDDAWIVITRKRRLRSLKKFVESIVPASEVPNADKISDE